MTHQSFINGLKILCSIDRPDWMSDPEWGWYYLDPYRYLMGCRDDQADKIMAEIEARDPRLAALPKELP